MWVYACTDRKTDPTSIHQSTNSICLPYAPSGGFRNEVTCLFSFNS